MLRDPRGFAAAAHPGRQGLRSARLWSTWCARLRCSRACRGGWRVRGRGVALGGHGGVGPDGLGGLGEEGLGLGEFVLFGEGEAEEDWLEKMRQSPGCMMRLRISTARRAADSDSTNLFVEASAPARPVEREVGTQACRGAGSRACRSPRGRRRSRAAKFLRSKAISGEDRRGRRRAGWERAEVGSVGVDGLARPPARASSRRSRSRSVTARAFWKSAHAEAGAFM